MGRVWVGVFSTVCDQRDADRMLAEIVRVMQPGGRIGIVVRAVDMPKAKSQPREFAATIVVRFDD
jgi:hypothetical protein